MTRLDWQWCQKNEWFLWEMVKQEREQKISIQEYDFLSMERFRISNPGLPENAHLYLALRAVEEIRKRKVDTDLAGFIKKAGFKEIAWEMACYCF